MTTTRSVRAVVASDVDGPAEIGDLLMRPVGAGEVRIAIEASGICHSDVSLLQGRLAHVRPAVLGHEGVGHIVEIGVDVVGVGVGDRVVIALQAPCGRCERCLHGLPSLCSNRMTPVPAVFSHRGEPIVTAFRCGTLAEETIVRSQQVIPIEDEVPAAEACLLGCGVLTGFGAVFNTASLRAGQTVAVVGCGGVGSAVIQAARVAGASTIVAIDRNPQQLAAAVGHGATHVCTSDEASARVAEITDGLGVDVSFEVVGSPAAFSTSFEVLGRGGLAVLVGAPAPGTAYSFDANAALYAEKRFAASFIGGGDARRDIGTYLAMRRSGQVDLAALVTQEVALDDAPAVIAALAEGSAGVRSVVRVAS